MSTWNPRANEIFLNAAELTSLPERQAYLDEACGPDTDLRHQVEEFLRAQFAAGDFLERPLAHLPADPQPVEGAGSVIGPYQLLEQIGEGGFGIVFRAEQTWPVHRTVALKIIKPGMDTKQVIARFEAERQTLALMEHPNIASVFDGGTTEYGRPYFVMELVNGIPINQFCDQQRMSLRARLSLFVDVCHAVQHAHQKGVIHRDLKPSNLLVARCDGTPVVKVIDFGVAKATGALLTGKTTLTAFAQFIGTPTYMSPEQACSGTGDIDTRSDVYSLGVLLYELLTGTTPFTREALSAVSYDELRRMICEDAPPALSARISSLGVDTLTSIAASRQIEPSTFRRHLRGELNWIVMRALEKDRTRRYESASAFAADVERYLQNEPVLARPTSVWYRLKKLAQRRRGMLVSLVLVLSTLVVGGAVALWQAVRAASAEQGLLVALDRAEERRYAAEVFSASQLQESGDSAHAQQLLDHWLPAPGERDRRGLAWRLLARSVRRPGRELMQLPHDVSCVRLTPDNQTLVGATDGGVVRRLRLNSQQELPAWETNLTDVRRIAISPDGALLALISYEAEVVVLDMATGSVRQRLPAPADAKGPPDVEFFDATILLATGCGPRIRVWNAVDGSLRDWIPDDETILDCAVSPGLSGCFLLGQHSSVDFIWCFKEPFGEEYVHRHLLQRIRGEHCTLAASHQGSYVAVGTKAGQVWVIDWRTHQPVAELALTAKINDLCFSRDDQWLAIAEHSGAVHLWRWQDPGEPLLDYRGKIETVETDSRGVITATSAERPPLSLTPEFRVNTFTADNQVTTRQSVAMDAAGNFVVVWASFGQFGPRSGYDILAQRFTASGALQGAEFLVNRLKTQRTQHQPAVAMNSRGDFVVVWASDRQDGSGYGIYARCFSATGTLGEEEFLVNTNRTEESQHEPAVAISERGDFVVAWLDHGSPKAGFTHGVFARRFRAGGIGSGPPFHVNADQTSLQAIDHPAVAIDAAGNLMVAWPAQPSDEQYLQIQTRRFPAAGLPAPATQPLQPTGQHNADVSLAINARGDGVLAWMNQARDQSRNDVYLLRLDPDGSPRGVPMLVTGEHSGLADTTPSVAIDDEGTFLVAWASSYSHGDGDGSGVYARRYDATGSPLGSEFLVNNHTVSHQEAPAVALNGRGQSVIVWSSFEQDGSRQGVYAQQPARDAELLQRLQAAVSEQREIHVQEDQRGRVTVEFVSETEQPTVLPREHAEPGRDRPSLIHWQAHPGPARSVIFPTNQRHLISAGIDGRIMRWAWGQKGDLTLPFQTWPTLAWATDRQALLVPCNDDVLRFVDPQSGQELGVQRPPGPAPTDVTATSRDGRWLAWADLNGPNYCWDLSRTSEPFVLPRSEKHAGVLRLLEFSADGNQVVVVTDGWEWIIWDLRTRAIVSTRAILPLKPQTSTWSPFENCLYVLTADELIALDGATGAERSRVPWTGPGKQGHRLMMASPVDGLLAICNERQIHLVDGATGNIRETLVGHAGHVKKLSFTPDGRTLLSRDERGKLKLWQVPHGNLLLTWPAAEPIRDFALSPDGQWLMLVFEHHTTLVNASHFAPAD